VPQLVEALLERHLPRARNVLEPVCRLRDDARPVARERTRRDRCRRRGLQLPADAGQDGRVQNLFTLETELRDSLRRLEVFDGARAPRPHAFVDAWYGAESAAELVFYRSLIEDYEHGDSDAGRPTRAARSARRTTHFDLDSRASARSASTGATSTRRSLPPDLTRRALPPPLRAGHARAIRTSRALRAAGPQAVVLHGDAPRAGAGRARSTASSRRPRTRG